jgi:hypothetical protein
MKIMKKPNEALNDTVSRPTDGFVGSGEYAPIALKAGMRVAPYESQKPPFFFLD